MDLSYEKLTAFAKSFGLIYMMAIFVGVIVYAYWPSAKRKRRFDKAANSILDDEDGPERGDSPCR